jgi:GTP-binding protein EngB required for normal cell division
MPIGTHDSLNWSHKLHLRTSFKYADELLSDIESVLATSTSKSPFPKYREDLSPVQIKVIQDYTARIRAQMIQLLKSQGISPPERQIGATHAIRVNLEFAIIAFEDCRPDALRGYGEVPESVIPELNGLVEEMRSLIRKLSTYLNQDTGQDPQARLRRLESTTDEIELLKTLEPIINGRGLVEFRPALSIILDKIESKSFQISLFGRVSSGKSSLLNHILEMDVLPVGVNPITSVPTRITHGLEPALTVTYLDRKQERAEIARLPEFVSEQFNAGNIKRVTRIIVQLPSRRLQDGVMFVDTPGLGSLAAVGATETLAYLPHCDLGVVLVDAGSTLTQEDLSTLQSLYEAAIPAFVLLSKADLLNTEDRDRSIRYIAAQISSQLGVKLTVHPVSIKGEYTRLLDEWFEHEIQPLCERHQELAQKSVRRKTGALREAVEAALKVRTELAERGSKKEKEHLWGAETELRKATGKFEEASTFCFRASDEIRLLGRIGLSRAAIEVAQLWSSKDARETEARGIVNRNLARISAEGANQIYSRIQGLSQDLSRALAAAATAMDVDVPREEDLTAVAKEMPRLDTGPIEVSLNRDFLVVLGKAFVRWRIEKKLQDQIGTSVDEAFQGYGRMLESWSQRTLAELHRQFDAHADGYRAQIERLTGEGAAGPEETEAIRRDLETLSRFDSAQPVPATGGSD